MTCTTVFVRRYGHIPLLQPLYEGPYAILRRSLHHFTQHINNREDKVSTLQLKPCNDPTTPPAQPMTRGHQLAAVRFSYFPPPGATVACRVHFASPQMGEPHREPFTPGQPPGVFAHPAPVPATAPTRPACDRRTDLTSRPLASRSRGSPVEAITASSQTTTFLCICARYALRMHVGTPTT
jgi:hypothetical protein